MKISLHPSIFHLAKCLLVALVGFSTLSTFAQNKTKQAPRELDCYLDADRMPGLEADPCGGQPATYAPPALWDMQFEYGVGDTVDDASLAGATFTDTEFWVSSWDSDTLYNFTVTGDLISTFQIPGVSGTRSLTWDGSHVWVGNNTPEVYKVDPISKTVVDTIIAPEAVRFITWDSTADGGGGGFYLGNWGSDIIFHVDTNGTELSSIPVGVHGMTGLYGIAFDNISTGGPYLWTFDQGGAISSAEITRLELPLGTPTVVTRDVSADFGPGGGTAGGLFITDKIVPGEWTIGGLLQTAPDIIFGYDLDDFSPPTVDAVLQSSVMTGGYTKVPLKHVYPIFWTGEIQNLGGDTLVDLSYAVDVQLGGTSIFSDTQSVAFLPSVATSSFITASFTPTAMGIYEITTTALTSPAQPDTIANNIISFIFEVTDTIFSRDDGVSRGGTGYFVGGDSWAEIGALYTLQTNDTLTSVWVRLETPISNDTTFALVSSAIGGTPGPVFRESTLQIIDSGINEYVLVFPNGVPMTPGDWLVGIYEGEGTGINVSHSNNIYTPGVNFFNTQGATPWTGSGIETARFIRPNFGEVFVPSVGIQDQALPGTVRVYPNPAKGRFLLDLEFESPQNIGIEVLNMLGQVIQEYPVEQIHKSNKLINLENEPGGVYFLRVSSGTASATYKIVSVK